MGSFTLIIATQRGRGALARLSTPATNTDQDTSRADIGRVDLGMKLSDKMIV